MADESKVGHVTHYFGKIHVAAIELTDGELSVGDTVHVHGHTSDFLQKVESMQIDRAEVTHAERGQEIAIRVGEHAREGDVVEKVLA